MFKTMQKPGMVSRAAIKYYKDWTITAYLNGELKFQASYGPYREKGSYLFRLQGSWRYNRLDALYRGISEKHKCHVVTSGWWQEIFDYPELEYVKPGDQVPDVYATYQVGCFDEQLHLNVQDWRLTPLQKVAADILGLDYEPIRAKLKFTPHRAGNGSIPGNYVCFSEFSTMRNKLWNRPGAWQELINFLNDKNYKCVSISNEESQLTGVIKHNNQSIQNSIADIAGAEFYIGLNAGPSWIAYALGLPVVMITGVSEVWNDFPKSIPDCYQ
jgi:ADP-heptose:LPS heptosyltransferase